MGTLGNFFLFLPYLQELTAKLPLHLSGVSAGDAVPHRRLHPWADDPTDLVLCQAAHTHLPIAPAHVSRVRATGRHREKMRLKFLSVS